MGVLVQARPDSGNSSYLPPPNTYTQYEPPTDGYQDRRGSNVIGGDYGVGSLVQKHIYVHVPPPETEEHIISRPLPQFRQAQKHYKIVFIKTPTPPTHTAANIQLPGQDEQKTLIYVLVKKPDEAGELNIQQPTPTQPSKPEVYFIKYKTQKQISSVDTSKHVTPTYGVPGPY